MSNQPLREHSQKAICLDRYALHQHADGTWAVFDRRMCRPAVVKGISQIGLEMDAAGDMVDLLNRMEWRPSKE